MSEGKTGQALGGCEGMSNTHARGKVRRLLYRGPRGDGGVVAVLNLVSDGHWEGKFTEFLSLETS